MLLNKVLRAYVNLVFVQNSEKWLAFEEQLQEEYPYTPDGQFPSKNAKPAKKKVSLR
jgi:hypothetical protein